MGLELSDVCVSFLNCLVSVVEQSDVFSCLDSGQSNEDGCKLESAVVAGMVSQVHDDFVHGPSLGLVNGGCKGQFERQNIMNAGNGARVEGIEVEIAVLLALWSVGVANRNDNLVRIQAEGFEDIYLLLSFGRNGFAIERFWNCHVQRSRWFDFCF